MYFTDIVRRSGRSLFSAKVRTILTAFAIAVGAFALTLTLAASNGAKDYANKLIQDNFDPSELVVSADKSLFNSTDDSKPQVYDQNFTSLTNGTGAATQVKSLSDGDLQRIGRLPGVQSVRPGLSLNLQYITRDGQKMYVATMQAFNQYKKPDLLAGSIPAAIPSGSLILPEGFVSALGFANPQQAIGKTVRLAVQQQLDRSAILSALTQGGSLANAQSAAQAGSKEQTFKVIAVTQKPSALVQPGTALYLYGNESDVRQLYDFTTQGSISYHKYLLGYAKVKDGTNSATLQAAQDAIKKAGYGAQSVKDTEKTLTQLITVLQGIVTVFGLIAVIASVFGIVNTMYISVLQRVREIGLMKALGMHKRDITRLFRIEAALLGFLGGLLGSAAAVVLGLSLNPWITRKLQLGSQPLLHYKLEQIGILLIVLIVVATIAGLLPARKASRLDPIEALRTE